MKKIVFIACMILNNSLSFAQEFPQKKYSVGLQGGAAALEFVDWGFNYQINLERNYKTGISLGASFGSFHFNDFPDVWEMDGGINEVDGVKPAVHDYILENYSAREAIFGLNWSAYRVNYYQSYVSYRIPFELLRTSIRVKSGLSYIHWTYFTLDIPTAISLPNGRMQEFTSRFTMDSGGLLGWNLGGGFERRLTPSSDFIADFSYQLPFGVVHGFDGFVTILIGVSYGFGDE